MQAVEVPVLIVGGGGCGLCASIFLSDHGVGHLLVERHASTSNAPKAHYLNQRTMEIFRQHGLDVPVLEQGAPLENFGKVRWMTSLGGNGPLDGRVIYELDAFGGGALRDKYAAAGPVLASKLPQVRLEPILRRHAEQRNPGRILFGHELTAFSDQGDRVIAEVRDIESGEITTVAARYVVAADAGRTLGPALGIAMEGPPATVNVTTAYFSADLSAWWHPGSLVTFLLNPYRPELFSTLIEFGPTWGMRCQEWGLHFPAFDLDTANEQAVIAAIRDRLGLPDLDLTLLQARNWTQEGLVADRYRVGRVVVAGDAAHRQPPAVGLGLNSGIQDAHNLAWKLAAVLAGSADDSLLDTYEAERRPVSQHNIAWAMSGAAHHMAIMSAMGVGPLVPAARQVPASTAYFEPSAFGALARARAADIFGTYRSVCQAHDVEIGFAYEAGAVVPDGSEPLTRAPMRDVYHPTTRPGHLLPHAWLERGGRRMSTHDLTGAGTTFVLITGPQGAPWCEAAAQVEESFAISIYPARIGNGAEFADVDRRWEALRQITDAGAILVRPDNHVAWRSVSGCDNPAEVLTAVMTGVLAQVPQVAAAL